MTGSKKAKSSQQTYLVLISKINRHCEQDKHVWKQEKWA